MSLESKLGQALLGIALRSCDGDGDGDGAVYSSPQELQSICQTYHQAHNFKVGDLVQWKPGMRNKNRPKYEELGVVVGVLEHPVFPSKKKEASAGSCTFREPLNLLVGYFCDGEFVVQYFDKQRFTPTSSPASSTPKGLRLLELCSSLTRSPERPLQVGDVVRWKPGLQNKAKPAAAEACVVLEVLAESVHDANTSSLSPYFMEPLTVKLGLLDSDKDLVVFHFDARRFERYQTA